MLSTVIYVWLELVIIIIWLMFTVWVCPKVITLSGLYCTFISLPSQGFMFSTCLFKGIILHNFTLIMTKKWQFIYFSFSSSIRLLSESTVYSKCLKSTLLFWLFTSHAKVPSDLYCFQAIIQMKNSLLNRDLYVPINSKSSFLCLTTRRNTNQN